MADKNITIKVAAVGTRETARELGRDADAVKALGNQAARTGTQIEAAQATNNKFSASAVNMRGAVSNLGFQLQDMAVQAEMGVSPLRIISQQVPQLLGGFGAFGAIAGAAIGLGVPLAASLFKIGDGARTGAVDLEKLNESLDDLKSAYEDIYKLIGEDQENAAKKAAQRVSEAIKAAGTQAAVGADAATLNAAREKAATQLSLAQDRIKLVELEQRISLATGNDALRLAKQREETIRRIYDTELKIGEVARKQALAGAEAKVGGAAKVLGATTVAAQGSQQELAGAEAKQAALREEAGRLATERFARLEAAVEQIKKQNELLYRQALDKNAIDEAIAIKANEPKELADVTRRLSTPSFKEENLLGEAGAMQTLIDQIKGQSEAATAAQKEAADAMNEAARALVQLRESQGVERKSEAELKATEAIGEVGRDVTQAALDAIAAIQANAADQGRAVNPGEQEAIGRIQSLVNDTTPDAQQGGRLAGLLQSLSNNLTTKDAMLSNGIDRIITSTKNLATKYQGLADKISDLQTQINQIRVPR